MTNTPKVALVDDDIIYRITTKKLIEHKQLANEVMFFSDGEEAIDFLRLKQNTPTDLPDIILLDINMPVMDGWDFLEEYILLKPKIGKSIMLYIVSSSVSKEDIIRSKKISAVTDYIVKPITDEDLATLFESI